jgi:hypothetical protein
MDRAIPALLLALLPALFSVREAVAAPLRFALQIQIQSDTGERAAAAEALFDEGRRLMSAGRYPEACARFADSERLDHGVGTLLNLADCFEKNGQTASAWAGFRAAHAAASAEGQPDRERIAEERELALQPLLARLTIAPPPQGLPAGAEVRRDGVSLGPSLWGSPVPVDPGDHAVLVAAPGKIEYLTTVHVPGQPGASIVARLPVLRERPAPPPAALAPAPEERPLRSPRATAGLVLLGLGGAGVVVGSIFGVRALGLKGDSSSSCRTDDHCSVTGLALRQSARASGTASTIAFAAAGALAAGGLVLTMTAPERQGIKATAGLSGGIAGVTLGATW